MLPASEARAVWISTFHRLCSRLLREHGTAIGVPADFRIVDEAERLNVMRQCMFDANVDTRVHKPQTLLHRMMSVIKNRMQVAASPDNWHGDEYAVRDARLCAASQAALAEANGLDFDDMLLATVGTLEERPTRAAPPATASRACWSTSTRTRTCLSTSSFGSSSRGTTMCS